MTGKIKIYLLFAGFMMLLSFSTSKKTNKSDMELKIDSLLSKMTLKEKIGQMVQINAEAKFSEKTLQAIRNGLVGSVLNSVNVKQTNKIQRIAREESPNGIPLLMGRDVIHGFKTIFPIPLGMAATWNPEIIEEGSHVAALEAASCGINWTFAPMVDVSRDARWGRIAESFGEDPLLNSIMGEASVRGFQGDDLSKEGSIAACAKHFAGYGAAESGIDYNTVSLPEIELRNTIFPPFEACKNAGVATFMSAFNDLNGIPASGNQFLFRQILRDEWQYDGMVVSDWASISQMITHGFVENNKEAALKAITAGIDMEMASRAYINHLEELINEGKISVKLIDNAVRNILRVKFRLGLFENPYTNAENFPELVNQQHREAAKRAAIQSLVLLKNNDKTLPANKNIRSIAIIGPLADDPYEQMGTWSFDGDPKYNITPLQAIKDMANKNIKINYIKTLDYSRSKSQKKFDEAVKIAQNSDMIIYFGGEEAILSGEAHCRAEINLPGIQDELIETLAQTGKPLVVVLMAGRPLTIKEATNHSDALIYAWHPGTMGGPAIADVLFGKVSPSGKLPITFPEKSGQLPIYYYKKMTGKPVTPDSYIHIDSIPQRAVQYSVGNTAFHMDVDMKPVFPFGFGLTYTTFSYSELKLSANKIDRNSTLKISINIKNTGDYKADEVVQLYVRDKVASITRPVKELKDFKRITLNPGESKQVIFELKPQQLAFYNNEMKKVIENGKFQVWVGSSSECELTDEFELY